MKIQGRLVSAAVVIMTVCGITAQAQAMRDPTLVPRAPATGASAAAGMMGSTAMRDLALAVLVADGKPFVMLDSRLYGVGDKLGSARVERITESEIWLREGKDSRKISLYPGVQRLPHVPAKE